MSSLLRFGANHFHTNISRANGSLANISHPKQILVLGYYHQNNLGDDIFEVVLADLYNRAKITKKDVCELIFAEPSETITLSENTISIVCGGGDVFNEYFIGVISNLVSSSPNFKGTINAVGVGISFPSVVENGMLDIFDNVILRNKTDVELVGNRIGFDHVHFVPDIAHHLPKVAKYGRVKDVLKKYGVTIPTKTSRKPVGVFLAQASLEKCGENEYNNIVSGFVDMIDFFVEEGFEVYLFAFNTGLSIGENDVRLNSLIKSSVFNTQHVYNIENRIDINDVDTLIASMYFNVCMRFHACVLSINNTVPFIPIFSTRKVRLLLQENDLSIYGYELSVDQETYAPTSFDRTTWMESYNLLNQNYKSYKLQLNEVKNSSIKQLGQTVLPLLQIVTNKKRITAPYYRFLPTSLIKQIEDKIVKVLLETQFTSADHDTPNNKSRFEICEELLRDPIHSNKASLVAEIIIHICLFGKKSESVHGLKEKLFKPDFSLSESIKWIMQHDCPNNLCLNQISANRLFDTGANDSDRKFNLLATSHDYLKGFHRSGWNYVTENLYQLHNPNGFILDTYLDRTFHWQKKINSIVGDIPYTSTWTGFIHHTFNEEYSEYNVVKMFQQKEFIDSLPHCAGLFVLSDDLKVKVSNLLVENGFGNIMVESLIHPTENNVPVFSMTYFLRNEDRKIVQIGAWLRDTYAIYAMPIPPLNPLSIRKCALKGPSMNNYYLNQSLETIVPLIKEFADDPPGESTDGICRDDAICRDAICRDDTNNVYIRGLLKHILVTHNSVEVIEQLNNDEYDELLTKNIVFMNLVDASASNAVIECIVRNTPILVNRLPAVEQYLGKNYPLYYTDLYDAAQLATDRNKIAAAYVYLTRMNKSVFTIDYFLNQLKKTKVYQSLAVLPKEIRLLR